MTIKLGLIGHPVSHSISPVLHIAALRHCGLSGDYLLLDTPADAVADRLSRLPQEGFTGVNVTVPHKQVVIPHMASLTDAAQRCGAVNTIKFDAAGAHGHNTDMAGFLHALNYHDMAGNARGMNVCVAGAGGAARAALWALNQLEPRQITLVARRADAGRQLLAEVRGRHDDWRTEIACSDASEVGALHLLREQIDLLVNCTSIGVTENHDQGLPEWACSLVEHGLRPGAAIFDMVYKKSLFAEVAARHNHRFADGLEMLLGQAVLAFEYWTQQSVPIEVMRAALDR